MLLRKSTTKEFPKGYHNFRAAHNSEGLNHLLRYVRPEKGGKKSYGTQELTDGKEKENSSRGPRQHEVRHGGLGNRQQTTSSPSRIVRHRIDRRTIGGRTRYRNPHAHE